MSVVVADAEGITFRSQSGIGGLTAAAIALPAVAGAIEASRASAANVAGRTLRNAMEMYAIEHNNKYPTASRIAEQLTKYTDAAGNVSAIPSKSHRYGPYLGSVPPVPAGPRKGARGIGTADAPGVGWIYDPAAHTIGPNTGLHAVKKAPAAQLPPGVN